MTDRIEVGVGGNYVVIILKHCLRHHISFFVLLYHDGTAYAAALQVIIGALLRSAEVTTIQLEATRMVVS